jgi:hypothetical protein
MQPSARTFKAPLSFSSRFHESPEAIATIIWALILAAIFGRLLLSPRGQGVYPIFTEAARHWLHAKDLYRPTGEAYRYSPLVAVFFVPFSWLPDRAGGILWRFVNAAAYIGALAWWCRTVLPASLTAKQRALFFLLVVPLSVGSLNNGQSNPLVLGLLLAAGAAVLVERWNLASSCIAVACLFKLYPIAFGLLLVLGYPRKLGLRLVAAIVIGLAAPFLLGRFDYVLEQYCGWIQHLATDDRQTWPLAGGYRDVRMLFRLWFTPLSGSTYLVVQTLAGAGIALACLWNRSTTQSARSFLTSALVLGCCWMTLFGPATESSTYMLVAPALAWAIVEAWRRRQGWAARGILVMSFALFTTTQVLLWFPGGARFQNLGSQPCAGLLLFGVLVVAVVRPATDHCAGRLEPKLCTAYDRAA